MTTPNQQLNALSYPYADVTHSETLLLSALWFDNIYVLEPNFFRPPRRRNQVFSGTSDRNFGYRVAITLASGCERRRNCSSRSHRVAGQAR